MATSRRGEKSRRFTYQSRDADAVKKRSDQGGRDFDSYIRDDIKMYKPKAGDNIIRILPPTWDDAQHFGTDIWLHYGVGAEEQTYLCLNKMKGEACPMCEEREKAQAKGDQEYADSLKPNKRVLVYLIDRDEEKEGPYVWSMPWTIDRDICKLVVDKRTGELLPIDHPEEGYDIEFERKGTAQRTEYLGLAVARRPSPLGDDDWLDVIADAPLPDLLQYFEYDHIAKVFGTAGGRMRGQKDDAKDSKDEKRESKDRSSSAKDSPPPKARRKAAAPAIEDLTPDEIREMDWDGLVELVDENPDQLASVRVRSSDDEETLAQKIIDALGIEEEEAEEEPPAPKRRSTSASSPPPRSAGSKSSKSREPEEDTDSDGTDDDDDAEEEEDAKPDPKAERARRMEEIRNRKR